MKKDIIILTGPTAVGKSDLAVSLAKDIGGMIISADSMQVYKGMDIGTAKITNEEMQGVPHFLINVLEPDEEFNVSSFVDMANEALDKIYECGAIPVIAGGTAFYIQALLKQVDFADDSGKDEALRKSLEEKSEDELFKDLSEVDPESAAAIHKNNKKRLVRALEYFTLTGEKISDHNRLWKEKASDFNFAYFVLTDERSVLYERINRRVDEMFDAGLVEEVKALKTKGFGPGLTSMQAIGYREVWDYLEGLIGLEEAREKVKLNTRHFAKRQLTWFRKEPDVIWLDYSVIGRDREKVLGIIKSESKNRGII